MKDEHEAVEKVEFRQPTTPAEVLRLGREFRKLRDTVGYQMFLSLLDQRYKELAVDGMESRDPAKPREYWQGRMDELKDIRLIVELAVLNADQAIHEMQQKEAFEGHSFPFASGGGTLVGG